MRPPEEAAEQPTTDERATQEPTSEEPDGRSRLVSALRPRATRSQLAAGALCLLLGLGLVTTVREQDTTDLSTLRESDLITLLDNTSTRAARLQDEAADLARTRQELRAASGDSRAAREVARERLDVLEILAGTAPATGPGITLTLSGAGADADLLLSTIQELRDAGAEAIALADVRVVASTYVSDGPTDADGSSSTSVVVDGTEVSAPFTFQAIGDPATLASAMSFPGGVLPTLSASGGTGEVQQEEVLEITAVRETTATGAMTPRDPGADAGGGS